MCVCVWRQDTHLLSFNLLVDELLNLILQLPLLLQRLLHTIQLLLKVGNLLAQSQLLGMKGLVGGRDGGLSLVGACHRCLQRESGEWRRDRWTQQSRGEKMQSVHL